MIEAKTTIHPPVSKLVPLRSLTTGDFFRWASNDDINLVMNSNNADTFWILNLTRGKWDSYNTSTYDVHRLRVTHVEANLV